MFTVAITSPCNVSFTINPHTVSLESAPMPKTKDIAHCHSIVNQSLFNPEWIYGMQSPTAPASCRSLVWHTYSAQAYGIFHGDLDFYFGGWDGRSRLASINTAACPVYMLTGEYDWSNTPAMAEVS